MFCNAIASLKCVTGKLKASRNKKLSNAVGFLKIYLTLNKDINIEKTPCFLNIYMSYGRCFKDNMYGVDNLKNIIHKKRNLKR